MWTGTIARKDFVLWIIYPGYLRDWSVLKSLEIFTSLSDDECGNVSLFLLYFHANLH